MYHRITGGQLPWDGRWQFSISYWVTNRLRYGWREQSLSTTGTRHVEHRIWLECVQDQLLFVLDHFQVALHSKWDTSVRSNQSIQVMRDTCRCLNPVLRFRCWGATTNLWLLFSVLLFFCCQVLLLLPVHHMQHLHYHHRLITTFTLNIIITITTTSTWPWSSFHFQNHNNLDHFNTSTITSSSPSTLP